ncbi:MAG: ACT domain-containing protein [Acutalibacteraceae bacterium]
MKPTITVCDDITLITLQNIPADINFVTEVFEKIAAMDIDVDMISLSPVQSSLTSLSFTVKDEELVKILGYTSTLNNGTIKPIVSSGNCKISINDAGMENCPGVAAKIFRRAADVNTDIRLITTSEAQISLLVTKSDFDSTFSAVQDALD